MQDQPWTHVTWRRRVRLFLCRVLGHRLQGIDVPGWDWCLRCEDAVPLGQRHD